MTIVRRMHIVLLALFVPACALCVEIPPQAPQASPAAAKRVALPQPAAAGSPRRVVTLPPVTTAVSHSPCGRVGPKRLGVVRDLATDLFDGVRAVKDQDARPIFRARLHLTDAAACRLEFVAASDFTGATVYLAPADAPERAHRIALPKSGIPAWKQWSPTVFSDIVDVVVVPTDTTKVAQGSPVRILRAAHFYADFPRPLDDCNTCDIDASCRNVPATARSATAAITTIAGGFAVGCSGVMVATSTGDGAPYFFTARDCVPDQAEAATTNFFWHYHTDACDGTAPSLSTLEQSVGARFIDGIPGAGQDDHTLLLIMDAVPASVGRVGWTTSPPAPRQQVYTIHHGGRGPQQFCAGEYDSRYDTSEYWAIYYSEGRSIGGSMGAPMFRSGSSTIYGALIDGRTTCSHLNGEHVDIAPMAYAYPNLENHLQGDPFENNDTRGQAQRIDFQTYRYLTASLQDPDWFTVEVGEYLVLRAWIEYDPAFGEMLFDIYLEGEATPVGTAVGTNGRAEISVFNGIDRLNDFHLHPRVDPANVDRQVQIYALSARQLLPSPTPTPTATPTPTPTCVPDGREPNNTCGLATLLNNPVTTGLTWCGDDDWYRIPANGNELVQVTLSMDVQAGNLDLELWETCAAPTSSSATSLSEENVWANGLTDFFVRVVSADQRTNAYEIRVQRSMLNTPTPVVTPTPTREPCVVDPYEPNDTCSDPTLIPSIRLSDPVLCRDDDWYLVPGPSIYDDVVVDVSWDPAEGNISLTLVTDCGFIVDAVDGALGFATVRSRGALSYRLQVTQRGAEVIPYQMDVAVVFNPTPVPTPTLTPVPCTDDAFEENDRCGDAVLLQGDLFQNLSHCDDDWYRFIADPADVVNPSVFFDRRDVDLALELYAGCGFRIDDSDGTTGVESVQGTGYQEYFIRVHSADSSTGLYDLEIFIASSQGEPLPTPIPVTVTHNFLPGWNAFAQGVSSRVPTSGDLLARFPDLEAVAAWTGDGWVTHIRSIPIAEQTLAAEGGYLLRFSGAATMTQTGDVGPSLSSLQPGWNLVNPVEGHGLPVSLYVSQLEQRLGVRLSFAARFTPEGWRPYVHCVGPGDFTVDGREGLFLFRAP